MNDLIQISNFRVPPSIHFGTGSFEIIGNEVTELGGSFGLVLADPNVVSAGSFQSVSASLDKLSIPYVVCTEVEPEPNIESVQPGLDILKKSKADVIIALGGGSTIDTAKVIAIIGKMGGDVNDYVGIGRIPRRGYPVIAVPTTSGTGSEVSWGAQLKDRTSSKKVAVGSHYMIPNAAIVDPLLTLSAPPKVAASTGIDALAHAIAAFTSRSATPITDLYALEAIRLIANNLRTSVNNRADEIAATKMALGSLYAGIAMSNAGGSADHALAYPIGSRLRLPHGVSIGLILPDVITYNFSASSDKFTEIALALDANISKKSNDKDIAILAGNACRKLISDVGLPTNLNDVGIGSEDLWSLATDAVEITRLISNNPRIINVEEAINIYQSNLSAGK